MYTEVSSFQEGWNKMVLLYREISSFYKKVPLYNMKKLQFGK